jgi:hypothetical protein
LNKQFCCWGHDDFSQCQDWTPWPTALGIGPVGAQYVTSYIFFIIFAVCKTSVCLRLQLTLNPTGSFCCLCCRTRSALLVIRPA